MKTIQWNRRAVEQAKAQGFDDPRHVICPGCGTNPAMRQMDVTAEEARALGAKGRPVARRGRKPKGS